MWAEDYKAMMIAKYGEDGYQLRELRECILERLPLHDDFTRDDLAVTLDNIIKTAGIVTKAAAVLTELVGEDWE